MEKEIPIIKHIVLSGGGQSIFTFYGVIKKANETGLWNISNIESIYGTSAGAILSLFIALKCDWKQIDDYLIKRPWDKVFNINLDSVVSIMNKFGFFEINVIHEIFKPLFAINDISIDITMKEFYEIYNIDIHIYTTELNKFEAVDISHTTHPDWRLLDAIYCSCNVPLLFAPYINEVNNEYKCYIDGGILCDFPLDICCEKYNKDNIFAIRKINIQSMEHITNESNFFNYMDCIFKKTGSKLLDQSNITNIKNIIYIYDNMVSIEDVLKVSSSKEKREEMINEGIKLFEDFYNDNYKTFDN